MKWIERAAEECCCWRRCLQRDKNSGLSMPRGSRAEVASPVLLHYDLSGTPLFEGNDYDEDDDDDDAMDVVLYDTTVEYVPTKSTRRIRTALSSDSSVENIRRQLLEADGHPMQRRISEEDDEEEEEEEEEGIGRFNHTNKPKSGGSNPPYCYEKQIEMESSSITQSRTSIRSSEYASSERPPPHRQDSAVVSMFRALRCIEGDDEFTDGSSLELPGSLEIRRPRRQKHPSSRPHQKGYAPIAGNVTIDY